MWIKNGNLIFRNPQRPHFWICCTKREALVTQHKFVSFFSSSFIKICIYRTFFSPKQDFESFKYGIVTQHKFVSFFSSSFIIICTYRKKIVTQHKFVSFFSFSVVIICTYRTFSPETIENFLPKQESLNMHLYISNYIVLRTLKDFAPEWLKSRNNNLNLDN